MTQQTTTKCGRGRPRKIRSAAELAKIAEKQKNKMTLAEKQAIKLRAQRAKDDAKKKRGEEVPKNKDRFYCTNKELQAELIKWRDSNIVEENKRIKAGLEIDYTQRTISNELANMMVMIGQRLLNCSNFRNYAKELKEDMTSQYYLKAIKGLKNYNFQFNNPFAWFTQCAYNSFITVIGKNYKHINLRKDLMKKLSMELETYVGINPNSALHKCIKSYLGDDIEV